MTMSVEPRPSDYLPPEIAGIVNEYAEHRSLDIARKALIEATGGPVGEGEPPSFEQQFYRRMGFASLRDISLAHSRSKIIARS